jgi:hypothetical protein
MTLTLLADSLLGRDCVTGGLAIGCIAALLAAIYLAKAADEGDDNDSTE